MFITIYQRADAQSTANIQSSYSQNMVKLTVKGEGKDDPIYGFITGEDKVQNVVYFVMFYPGKRYTPKSSVEVFVANGDGEGVKTIGANLLVTPARITVETKGETYQIFVYSAKGVSMHHGLYGEPSSDVADGYFVRRDYAKNASAFSPLLYKVPLLLQEEGNNNPVAIHQFVTTPQPSVYVDGAGLPVVDKNSKLIGLTLAAEKDGRVNTVRTDYLREQLHKLALNQNVEECTYFSLIETGHQETKCDEARTAIRLQREYTLQQRLQAELKRKQDSAVRANYSIRQKKEIAKDRDYPFALGISGMGGTRIFGGGVDIYLRPDKGTFRFTLKPRFEQYSIKPSGSEVQGASFQWEKATFQSVELPILFEGKSISTDGDLFYGIGYSYGQVIKNTLDYRLATVDVMKTEIAGNPKTVQKIWATLGLDIGKIRINAFGNYQLGTMLRKDFEVIAGNQYVRPFANTKSGQFFAGVELSYRLWARWQTGYKIL